MESVFLIKYFSFWGLFGLFFQSFFPCFTMGKWPNYTPEEIEQQNKDYEKWVKTYRDEHPSVLRKFPYFYCSFVKYMGPSYVCRFCKTHVYDDVEEHIKLDKHIKKVNNRYLTVDYKEALNEHRRHTREWLDDCVFKIHFPRTNFLLRHEDYFYILIFFNIF
jgi:hypothetical protein